jgi:hypothetical protein
VQDGFERRRNLLFVLIAVIRWGGAWKPRNGVKQLPVLDRQDDKKSIFDP